MCAHRRGGGTPVVPGGIGDEGRGTAPGRPGTTTAPQPDTQPPTGSRPGGPGRARGGTTCGRSRRAPSCPGGPVPERRPAHRRTGQRRPVRHRPPVPRRHRSPRRDGPVKSAAATAHHPDAVADRAAGAAGPPSPPSAAGAEEGPTRPWTAVPPPRRNGAPGRPPERRSPHPPDPGPRPGRTPHGGGRPDAEHGGARWTARPPRSATDATGTVDGAHAAAAGTPCGRRAPAPGRRGRRPDRHRQDHRGRRHHRAGPPGGGLQRRPRVPGRPRRPRHPARRHRPGLRRPTRRGRGGRPAGPARPPGHWRARRPPGRLGACG